MDKINFLAKDSFPASIETFDRMQKATNMAASLALLGGSNYILSGCEEKEGQIEPGIIVIAGEILPFVGGAPLEFITIQVTKHELEAFDELYPEAYIDRTVVFSAEGKLKWESVKRIITNQQLDDKIASLRGEPLAIKLDYTGRLDRIPENYMLADGRLLLTKDYPELAWYYGAEHQESFNLPDYSGFFIVGYDPTNPEYKEIGNTGGANEITLGIPNLPEHNHVKNRLFNKLSARASDINEQATPGSIDDIDARREYNVGSMSEDRWEEATIQSVGENKPFDNRPEYAVLAYIIKVKY